MGSRLATPVRTATLVVLAALFVLAAPASRAHAEFTGMVRLTPSTATNSDTKVLIAACPAGTQVITAGADTSAAGHGHVVIDVVRPDPTLTRVTLHAREDETGTSADWSLQAIVTCAPAPAGLALVKATSPTDSAAKSVIAKCPTGKRLLGTGGETTGASGQVLMTGFRPDAGLTQATVSAAEDANGTHASWSVTGYAICAPTPLGLRVVSATSTLNSTASRVATATCPSGLSAIGALGTINGATAHGIHGTVFPGADLTSTGITAFEDTKGTAANWSVTAYAVCAAGAKLATFSSGRGTWFGVATGDACPAGTYAVGVGADISGGFGRVSLEGMEPGSSFEATAASHDGAVDSWQLTSQGICSSLLTNTLFSSTTSLSDSSQQKIVTASCDSGQRLIGVSGVVHGDNVLLSSARPDPSGTSATAIAIEDEAGTDENWSLTINIVCAKPPPGLQVVEADTPLQSEDFQQITAACPAGKHVIGTGHRTLYDSAELMLDQVGVDPALSKVTMTVFEDHDGADAPWQASVYAFCINR